MRVLAVMLCLVSTVRADGPELVQNGDFTKDAAGWFCWFQPGQGIGRAEWFARGDGGALDVRVERAERLNQVQIIRGPFPVRQGRRYRVRFEARADVPFTLPVRLMLNDPPYADLGLSAEVPLFTDWQAYELEAVGRADADNARIDFIPLHSFQLDSVSVVEVDGAAALTKPAAVRLGPGWNGDPARAVDGNPATTVQSDSYPRLPAFLVVDLGAVRTLRQVVVHGRDTGRWVSTSGLRVEVSEDGRGWHFWATAAKQPAPTGTGPTLFRAASLAVDGRYARVRLLKLRNVAVVSEVEVAAGEPGHGLPAGRLPAVPPAADLSFIGWDYGRLGYDLTAGERPMLTWANQADRPVDVPVDWTVRRYLGPVVAGGRARLQVPVSGAGSVALAWPAELPSGPLLATASAPAETGLEPQSFFFDYRRAADDALGLRVVALMDTVDPEGWVRMIAGPLADRVAVYADWPEGVTVTACLVMAEAMAVGDSRLVRLREYLAGGGSAIVYGRPAPALRELLPVRLPDDLPDQRRAVAAPGAGPPWQGWQASGVRHDSLTVEPRAGAEVQLRFADGAPAVVAGGSGQGRVVYVATGSGQVWEANPDLAGADSLTLRLLYGLAGHADRLPAMLARAKEAAAARRAARAAVARTAGAAAQDVAVPGLDNAGRFGWRLPDGGLVENLRGDGTVDCPADPRAPFQPVVPGLAAAELRPVEQNWLAKTVAWQTEAGEVLRCALSLACPYWRWQGRSGEVTFPVTDDLRLAWPAQGGLRVLATGAVVDGRELTANGLLLFSVAADRRDVPRAIILARRPRRIELGAALRLVYDDEGFGTLWTGRLYGLRRFGPGETAAWAGQVPAEVAQALAAAGRRCLAFPTACDEVAWPEGETVVVADRFRYEVTRDAFGTTPETRAALPPVLGLAKLVGAPVTTDGRPEPTGVATKYGPLSTVAGDRAVYRIPVPGHDAFGVVPVAGRRELQAAMQRYAVEGIRSVTRASSGITSESSFNEDLRAYLSSGRYERPLEAPCLDLYKWWYCFPTIEGRPAYDEATRSEVDAHYRRQFRRTLNYHAHKSFVRFRREPLTGLDYTVTFIWPAVFADGLRFFIDQNESSAVLAACLLDYARYYGDWDTIRANWNLVRRLYDYLPRFHDWALMCSSNHEAFSTAGIDMLNSEYPGHLAYAELARRTGHGDEVWPATVLAAKSLVPAVARLAVPEYVASITAPGDPWRENRYYFSFFDDRLEGQPGVDMRGDEEAVMALSIGLLDTSKGTGRELPLAYKLWAPAAMEQYQRSLQAEERRRGFPVGWAHLMQRALLGWPRAELLAGAEAFGQRYPKWGWQSTKAPGCLALVEAVDHPLFLADWYPAEYVTGSQDGDTAELRLRNETPEPVTLRVYSQREVTRLRLGETDLPGWRYDRATGWLTAGVPGQGELQLRLDLGAPVAPPHPFYAKPAR